ncbi:N-acetylmuramoyl-L-alanine amidase [Viridibacillus sp. FSL E2-0187]|uniref:N-acetylmuramoyl-L-alanine amidase n=1 Tax=Viridibacillus sp. FSL E2-0187 TaxID=2921362 RepID=UPI0030F82DB7
MAKKYVISSGHSDIVRGAADILDEVNEARKVVNRVHTILTTEYNGEGSKFHDNMSKTQNQNLNTIVDYHNSKARDLDISVHFNAATKTNDPRGVECLYYDAKALSAKVSVAISKASGLKDRGAKERKELYFLNATNKPAILIEVCFVDSKADAKIYSDNDKFEAISKAIAEVIAGELGYKKKEITTVSKPSKSSNSSTAKSYYKSGTGLYRIKKGCYLYKTIKFDKNQREEKIEPGEAVTAKEIVKYGSAYRLKTKYGYVTADKEFVEKV